MPAAILIATNNPGKILEINAVLADLGLRTVLPVELGIRLDVAENGSSYAENAAGKALAFSRTAGCLTLADDSGLEVDALGGQPGMHSHRYSPRPEADDAERRELLLRRLAGRQRPWTARFRATVAVATAEGRLFYSEGICEGEIIAQERGEGGFGYDPIFLIPELGKTMAELSLAEKNLLSHRARAIRAAADLLRELTQLG